MYQRDGSVFFEEGQPAIDLEEARRHGFRAYCPRSENGRRCLVQGTAEAPEITVVIPVYNVQRYVTEAVESICAQTFRNIEILCINDGSTDRSLELVEALAAKDPRISVYTQKNSGLAAVRNEGIELARGKYVYLFDSDDLLEQNALELLYAVAEENRVDFVCFSGEPFFESDNMRERLKQEDAFLVDEDYPVSSGMEVWKKVNHKPSYCAVAPLKLYRHRFLAEEGLAFPEGALYEDFMPNTIAFIRAKRVCVIRDVLFHRRVREGSIVTSTRTVNNVIGYCTGYFRIIQELTRLQQSHPEDLAQVADWNRRWIRNAAIHYLSITPEGQAWFDTHCPAEWVCAVRAQALCRQKQQRLKEKNEKLKEQNNKLKQQNDKLKKTGTAWKEKHQRLLKSREYRLGRMITWLPRKIRSVCRRSTRLDGKTSK